MTDYYLYVEGINAQRTKLPLSINRWGVSTVFAPVENATQLTKEDAEALASILNKYGCPAKVRRFTQD